MSKWVNDFGNTYEDEESACDSVYEFMDASDYVESFCTSIKYDELLRWAMRQDYFWEDFSEQVREAEDNFFADHYTEKEEED